MSDKKRDEKSLQTQKKNFVLAHKGSVANYIQNKYDEQYIRSIETRDKYEQALKRKKENLEKHYKHATYLLNKWDEYRKRREKLIQLYYESR